MKRPAWRALKNLHCGCRRMFSVVQVWGFSTHTSGSPFQLTAPGDNLCSPESTLTSPQAPTRGHLPTNWHIADHKTKCSSWECGDPYKNLKPRTNLHSVSHLK